MLTVNEIKALCDVAGLGIDSREMNYTPVWAVLIYDKQSITVLGKCSEAQTEDEAIHKAWDNYVNSQRD